MYVSSMFFVILCMPCSSRYFFKEIYSRSKKTAKKILVFFFHFIAYVCFFLSHNRKTFGKLWWFTQQLLSIVLQKERDSKCRIIAWFCRFSFKIPALLMHHRQVTSSSSFSGCARSCAGQPLVFKWQLGCPPSLFQLTPQNQTTYQTPHLGYRQNQNVTQPTQMSYFLTPKDR